MKKLFLFLFLFLFLSLFFTLSASAITFEDFITPIGSDDLDLYQIITGYEGPYPANCSFNTKIMINDNTVWDQNYNLTSNLDQTDQIWNYNLNAGDHIVIQFNNATGILCPYFSFGLWQGEPDYLDIIETGGDLNRRNDLDITDIDADINKALSPAPESAPAPSAGILFGGNNVLRNIIVLAAIFAVLIFIFFFVRRKKTKGRV